MKEFLASGKRGLVYKAVQKGREVCIKEKNPESEAGITIQKETKFLKIMNKQGIGPEFIKADKDRIVMEFIQGERILDHLKRVNKTAIKKILKKVLDQARIMDEIKINKFELTNPYKHIIIRNEEPIMIDFERCRISEQPKNVTQTIQFFTSTRMKCLLKEKDLLLNKEKLIKLAKEYKESYSKEKYEEILKVIKQ
jgi:putative serine/threonine protein kinase